jgi:hypothetical protein
MAEDLADAIVVAAKKMEKVEDLFLIASIQKMSDGNFHVQGGFDERTTFGTFTLGHNLLAKKGYRMMPTTHQWYTRIMKHHHADDDLYYRIVEKE